MGRKKIHRDDVTCAYCGKVFTPTSKQYNRHRSNFYCEPACAYKAQGERLSKPLEPDQLKTLLELYEAGTPVKDIAAQVGVDSSTISKTAKANGLKPRLEYRPHKPKKVGQRGTWYIVLEVKDRAGRINYKKKTHLARCNHCGNERWYSVDHLDKVSSCGCMMIENRAKTRKERGTGHNECSRAKKSPEYVAWQNFRRKCRNSKGKITYDPRWDDLMTWIADIGRRPHPDYCFTRINQDGHYVPGNVEWRLRAQLSIYDITDHRDKHVGYAKIYQNPYKSKVIPRSARSPSR